MSESQSKIYEFIVEYVKEHLFPPTLDEICNACFYSSDAPVRHHLKQLEKKGLIELPYYGGARCIKLVGYKLVKECDNEKREKS